MKTRSEQLFKNLIRRLLVGNKAFILAILLFVALSLLSEFFLKPANLLNLLRQTSVSCIVALGFTFVIGLGEIDLSVGAVTGFIGVIMGILLRDANVPVPLAILCGFIVGVICGTINALVISSLNLPAFLVTLAGQLVFRGLCLILTGMKPIGPLPDSFNMIGDGYIGAVPIPIYIMVFAIVLMYFLADRTKFGRYVIAVGNNIESAKVSGIDIFKTRLYVYWTMGVCAAVSAVILTGRTASAQPTAGMNMELDAIAAVVMGGSSLSGGKTNIIGTMFGAIIIGLTANGLNLLSIATQYQIIAKGLLILLALVLDSVSTKLYANYRKKQTAPAE